MNRLQEAVKSLDIDLSCLTDREQKVYQDRFIGLSLKKVGEMFKVTQERIRQIEAMAEKVMVLECDIMELRNKILEYNQQQPTYQQLFIQCQHEFVEVIPQSSTTANTKKWRCKKCLEERYTWD